MTAAAGSTLYQAFRRRGHPALACLRVAYGPRVHTTDLPLREKLELAAMTHDLNNVLHECMCSGCDACVRDALWITVVDQTFGVAVGQEQLHHGWTWPHGPHWLLLVSWGDPYGHLTPDECIDLVHTWLRAAGWRPADGGERAAEICAAAGQVATEWAGAEATGTTFCG